MEKENKSFSEVLHNAKKLGYAESNPSSDLNGDDVAAKLKILTSLCFNSFLNKKIHVEGIKEIDKDDINYAKKLGYKIKLLGYAELNRKKYLSESTSNINKEKFLCCKHRRCS